MKFYNLLIKYRLWIGLLLIALGVYVNFVSSFWPAFPLYLVGVILVAGHFFFGPLRLIQEYMETGDMEGLRKSSTRLNSRTCCTNPSVPCFTP